MNYIHLEKADVLLEFGEQKYSHYNAPINLDSLISISVGFRKGSREGEENEILIPSIAFHSEKRDFVWVFENTEERDMVFSKIIAKFERIKISPTHKARLRDIKKK